MTLGTNVPTPAYNNQTIQSQFFVPSYFQISAIAFGNPTTITVLPNFGRDCNFVVGQQVLFLIPNSYGTYQLNNKRGIVLSVPTSTTFTVNISTSSSNYSAFIASPTGERQIAQVIPSGTIDTGNTITDPQDVSLINLAIPGSFTNTQPNVIS